MRFVRVHHVIGKLMLLVLLHLEVVLPTVTTAQCVCGNKHDQHERCHANDDAETRCALTGMYGKVRDSIPDDGPAGDGRRR